MCFIILIREICKYLLLMLCNRINDMVNNIFFFFNSIIIVMRNLSLKFLFIFSFRCIIVRSYRLFVMNALSKVNLNILRILRI